MANGVVTPNAAALSVSLVFSAQAATVRLRFQAIMANVQDDPTGKARKADRPSRLMARPVRRIAAEGRAHP